MFILSSLSSPQMSAARHILRCCFIAFPTLLSISRPTLSTCTSFPMTSIPLLSPTPSLLCLFADSHEPFPVVLVRTVPPCNSVAQTLILTSSIHGRVCRYPVGKRLGLGECEYRRRTCFHGNTIAVTPRGAVLTVPGYYRVMCCSCWFGWRNHVCWASGEQVSV